MIPKYVFRNHDPSEITFFDKLSPNPDGKNDSILFCSFYSSISQIYICHFKAHPKK